MGHVHLGELPKTRKWQQVVSLIEAGGDAASVAQVAMDAAQGGLAAAAKDKGLIDVAWLLMHLPAAAATGNFVEALAELGVVVDGAPTVAQITGAVCDLLDETIGAEDRTDLNEMAQMAALETLAESIGRSTAGMFNVTPEVVQQELARFATGRELGGLMRAFFSRLMNRYLGYYLSRELTHHVGEGRRFTTLAQHGEYNNALALHTHQAAFIIEAFSGEWASKTRYAHGAISRREMVKYVHGATRKLSDELLAGAK